jgi:hypothetical protein
MPKSRRITLANALKNPETPCNGRCGGFNSSSPPPPPAPAPLDENDAALFPTLVVEFDVEYDDDDDDDDEALMVVVACVCNSSKCEFNCSNPSFLYF